jgi:divalent metal cation (Fe/Co/Zn/Cd) transporter
MPPHSNQDQQTLPETPRAARRGMQVETWIFLVLTAFFLLAAVIYRFLAPNEPVGITALFLTAGLTFIVGTFLRFVSRRLEEPRPEDNDDAEVSDGAGDVGFFSPGSYWPFGIAFAAALTAFATAYFLVWLMVIGIGFLMFAICGLVFEYHRRPAHH